MNRHATLGSCLALLLSAPLSTQLAAEIPTSVAASPPEGGVSASASASATFARFAPSPLLAVDQNRAAIVEGIVGAWKASLGAAYGAATAEKEAALRAALAKLRADRLLAASLAGTLEGLGKALTEPEAAVALANTAGGALLKSLGDGARDLIYTPINPCRIVDTRFGGGGFLAAGTDRDWNASRPGGSFADQGGEATDCAIPAGPAALLANLAVTDNGAPGVLFASAYNQPPPTASTLNWMAGDTIANAVIVPLAVGQAKELTIFASAGTHVVIDVLGYFQAPAGGYVASVTAGTGISVSGTTTPSIAIASGYQLPQGCAGGQVPKQRGNGEWVCAADETGGGGGTVTQVNTGAGLTGGPITTTGTVSVAPGGIGSNELANNAVTTAKIADGNVTFGKLAGGCASGQVLKFTGAAWGCAADLDTNSGGTVTTLTPGAGITLSPSPLTGSGSIAADTNYLQRRVNQFCAPGWSIQSINVDGSVTCEYDDPGPAWSLTGNAGTNPATHFLGTTDNQALEIRVNNTRAMRYQPNSTSANVVGGHPNNSANAASFGQTIAGGGEAGSSCFDPETGLNFRFCGNQTTDSFATIGGGVSNAASGYASAVGGGQSNTAREQFGIVSGGRGNDASGYASAVAGGLLNEASGYASTAGGGFANTAGGDHSFAAGLRARVRTPAQVGGGDVDGDEGTFVWADATISDFFSERPNEFAVRAAGGMRLVSPRGISLNASDRPLITRAHDPFDNSAPENYRGLGRWGVFMEFGRLNLGMPALPAASIGFARYYADATHETLLYVNQAGNLYTTTGAIYPISDVAQKTAFRDLSVRDVLQRVVSLPIRSWAYRNSPESRHVGPTAQDFHAAFSLGVDDKHIATVDADGVALAAIQGLHEVVQEKDREIGKLKKRSITLERDVAELKSLVKALAAKSR